LRGDLIHCGLHSTELLNLNVVVLILWWRGKR
jgi:hypothetical protein